MRKYSDKNEQNLEAVICNQCSKSLRVENGIIKEGCYEGMQKFGYFSKKDGEQHVFDLCEECYNKFIAGFQIEAEINDIEELL